MQDSSGAFGIWGPSDGDMWLTSYVTDFLTRAKEAGYTVRQQAFNQALDRLQNYISYAQDFENGGEGRAYALYVLARNGRAPIGELRYYVDTRLDRFSTPLAQAQLGAALAMLGDKARAEKALQAALKTIADKDDGYTAARLRHRRARRRGADHAGLRDAASPRPRCRVWSTWWPRPTGPSPTPRRRSRRGCCWPRVRWPRRPGNAALDVNGAAASRASWSARCRRPSVKDGALAIANESDAAVDAVVSVVGAALTPEPAGLQGLHHRAHLLHARRQAGGPRKRHRRHGRAQAERPPGGGAEGRIARDGRPRPAGRPPAGRPRDREPAARRLRRHQDARLAQDHGEARAHRVPR